MCMCVLYNCMYIYIYIYIIYGRAPNNRCKLSGLARALPNTLDCSNLQGASRRQCLTNNNTEN